MLPSEPKTDMSARQRIKPQTKMPSAEVLRHLSADDAKLLRNTLAEPAEYIPHELLDSPAARQLLMEPVPEPASDSSEGEADADDSGVYRLANNFEGVPKLDREQHLFLRLNFCRRHVWQFFQQYKGKRLTAKSARDLLIWAHAVQEVRSQIVRENIPLVLAMAKRTKISGVDPSDLISEGNLALLRAANKFDSARGYKFSTYACRAILKSFSRVATRMSRHRGYFPTEFDPALEKSDYIEQRRLGVQDECVDELRAILDGRQAELSDVERKVIQARFALDNPEQDVDQKGKTLEQIGEMIGVTKERVRQIQNKALDKLRQALDGGVLSR
ncbi:MAG: sigma-70 family RNA polymerase sigma factor [Phycisphaerae bacterium]|nr:sigma-70 family RNA polymerase sigma factor [Phycisphaerae bacterium]